MADLDINGTEDEVQDKKQKKQTKHDGGAADLERVTDYAEEKEISTANISSVSFLITNRVFAHNIIKMDEM